MKNVLYSKVKMIIDFFPQKNPDILFNITYSPFNFLLEERHTYIKIYIHPSTSLIPYF